MILGIDSGHQAYSASVVPTDPSCQSLFFREREVSYCNPEWPRNRYREVFFSHLQECLDYTCAPLVWPHIFVKFKRNSRQMAICGAYEHTKVHAGLQVLSASQMPVPVSMLASWLFSPLLTLPFTLNFSSSWLPSSFALFPYNTAIFTMNSLGPQSLFCLSLLAPFSCSSLCLLCLKSSFSLASHSLSSHGQV